MSKTYIVDIESQPIEALKELFFNGIKAAGNLKDPEKIEADILKKREAATKGMSVDIDFCEIKCIGLKIDDEPAKIVSLEEFIGHIESEVNVAAEIASDFNKRHFYRLVTFNGKHFDLPVIIRQCLRLGIKSPAIKELQRLTKKWDSLTHIDLLEVLGNGEYKSLDLYSQIYLNWPKKPIDFETCSMEELHAHCIDDVEQSSKLYNKFKEIF